MKRNLGLIIPLFLCFTLLTGFGPAHRDPADLKNDPVSTTGSLYGFQDELQEDVLSDAPFELVTGKYEVSGIQRVVTDGYAASASGKTSLALCDSYLRSETEAETAPNTDRFIDLLVSGSLCAVQGLGTSQSFYINSSLIARNGAAALLDRPAQAPEKDAQRPSMYLYGSEAITADGGFGANTDIFSRLYVYGSHIQAAEAGILAGTDSNLTIGTIKDGEDNTALSGKLEDSETDRWKDKATGSVVEGGRNALVIYSEDLPEYWDNEGYSEEELLKKAASVSVKGSTLRTDEALDKGISYGEAEDAYIDHTKGSVVLIKSSNATITFEDCELIAGKDGKGNLIQTVISNDNEKITIPEDKSVSGVNISMKDMDVKGNILHEDYQRNLGLTLINTKLSGSINGYDAAHWNDTAAKEGFKDFCPDKNYDARRIAAVALTEGSSWTPDAESHLGWLYIDGTSNLKGKIIVDGVEQGNIQGATYSGHIEIIPADISSAPAVHDHNWLRADGGYPPDCENNGMKPYYCSICGEPYIEVLPALGHDWQVSYQYDPTCTHDGYADYICARCGNKTEVILPATAHSWVSNGGYPPVCEYDGMACYVCSVCGATYNETIPATGHHWERWGGSPPDCLHDGAKCYVCTNPGCGATYNEVLPALNPIGGHNFVYQPTKGNETMTHTRYCTICGAEDTGSTGKHTTGTPGGCAICGFSEPYG